MDILKYFFIAVLLMTAGAAFDRGDHVRMFLNAGDSCITVQGEIDEVTDTSVIMKVTGQVDGYQHFPDSVTEYTATEPWDINKDAIVATMAYNPDDKSVVSIPGFTGLSAILTIAIAALGIFFIRRRS